MRIKISQLPLGKSEPTTTEELVSKEKVLDELSHFFRWGKLLCWNLHHVTPRRYLKLARYVLARIQLGVGTRSSIGIAFFVLSLGLWAVVRDFFLL